MICSVDQEWQPVLSAFNSSSRDIRAGVDCVALEDYPGCVFHMMRVAEIGLRSIAKKLGVKTVKKNKPVEYAMWNEVIGTIRTRIDELRNTKGNKKALTVKARDKREKQTEAYSAIMSDMQAL